MPWFAYLALFVSGLLLTNAVPHFVAGVCGAPFQSPFAKPPGVGESSPLVNVLWGYGNGVAGALLLSFFTPAARVDWLVLGAAVLLMATLSAKNFGRVRAARYASEKRTS